MRVVVERDMCMGSGNCVVECADVFAQDETGTVVVLNENPPEDLREQVESAVATCPAACIALEG